MPVRATWSQIATTKDDASGYVLTPNSHVRGTYDESHLTASTKVVINEIPSFTHHCREQSLRLWWSHQRERPRIDRLALYLTGETNSIVTKLSIPTNTCHGRG